MQKRIFALVILLLSASHAQAGVYKWTDEQGRVHYGSQPPQAVEARPLDVRNQPSPVEGYAAQPGLRLGEQLMLNKIERQADQEERDRYWKQQRQETEKRFQAIDDNYNREMCDLYKRRYQDNRNKLTSGYTASEARYLHSKGKEYDEGMKKYCY